MPRQSGFDITAASEVMAILALSTSLADMKARLARIVVGYTKDGRPVTAEITFGPDCATVTAIHPDPHPAGLTLRAPRA